MSKEIFMRLITDYKDNLLLIDEDTSAIGDDFVWDTNRVKFVCSEDESTTVDKKIIAASPKLGDLPLLPELPKQEEDVEQLKEIYVQQLMDAQTIDKHEKTWIGSIWEQGYKASSKKWSDEDMIKFGEWFKEQPLIERSVGVWVNMDTHEVIKDLVAEYAKTHSSMIFEPEWEYKHVSNGRWYQECGLIGYSERRLKIVNGVLQGTYKF